MNSPASDPDPAQFRQALAQAGFQPQWKEKMGERAWGALEAAVGTLA